jgi:adenine phosphoribosyltransferase
MTGSVSGGPGGTGAGPAPSNGELADRLRSLIRDVPDFPRAGIVFKDVTAIFADAAAFRAAVGALAGAYRGARVDVVAGIESRGFVLGAAVAYALDAGFVFVRKQGKLPAAVISQAYSLEYGEAVLEMHADAITPGQRVLVVDDLLATGGTAAATVSLVEQLGGIVAGIAFLVELTALAGAQVLGGRPYVSLVRF